MSNLKHLITLACFLVGANFVFGQTLSITPSSGTYTPNGTQVFTVTLSDAVSCQGSWDISGISSSNYTGFSDETQSGAIVIGSGGTGSINLTFITPPSGDFNIDVMATKAGCSSTTAMAILSAAVVNGGGTCDALFFEGFEAPVVVGDGFSGNTPSPTPPVSVGQGTAGIVGSEMFTGSSYFEVVSGNRMEANSVGGEVFWESNDIPISSCCSRTISVDIYGENGEAEDYVEVYYAINKTDITDEVLIGRMTGTFSTTLSISSCNLSNITEASDLKIIVRIFNNNNMDHHGFDNVQVTAGTPVEAPQILNVSCAPETPNTTTTITASASSECSAEYSIDGGMNWQSSGIFTGVASGTNPTISVRDAIFISCGTSGSIVTIDATGNCNFVLPVTLLDFYGRAEADAIGLYWSTSTELNNDFIVVERSLNGIDFVKIGQVEGKGTTTEQQNYTFIDNYPVSGTNYYRLRQVDYDGVEELHSIISVLFDRPLEFGVTISPNPARETLQVDWSLPKKQDGMLRVFDLQGQLMSQRAIAHGSGRYNLPIRDLPAGLYVIQMEQGGKTETLRFVKQ